MKELNTICSMLIIAGIISFLGFALENIWLIFTKGFADNRNMNLPFLSGYSVIVLGMYFLFGTPLDIGGNDRTPEERYLIYFVMAFFTVSLGEIVLGTFMERFFGFEYWNYTRLPMHITKYTSVPTSLGFAFIITEFMGEVFPKLLGFTAALDPMVKIYAGIAIAVLLPLDFFISFREMYISRSLNTIWTIHIFPKGIPEMIKESSSQKFRHGSC